MELWKDFIIIWFRFLEVELTQNTDADATGTIVDVMSGTDKMYKEKCEVPVMFAPTTNITNPYGAQSLDSEEYDRYVVGNIRTNESPIQENICWSWFKQRLYC